MSAQQLDLGGLAPCVPTDRLFFALFPDPETAAALAGRIAVWRRELSLRARPIRSDRLHITLHHVGDFAGLPDDLVARAEAAADAVAQPSFFVQLDRLGSFRGRSGNHPLVLEDGSGAEDIHALRADLVMRLRTAGVPDARSGDFRPHLTLLYGSTVIPARVVATTGWQASSFVLVHSLLGRTEHRHLRRWSLSSQSATR